MSVEDMKMTYEFHYSKILETLSLNKNNLKFMELSNVMILKKTECYNKFEN